MLEKFDLIEYNEFLKGIIQNVILTIHRGDRMLEIIGQLLGIVAVVFGFISFQMKTSRGILIFQVATASLFAAHYYLLGAPTASALNVLAALFCVVYYFRDKRGSNSKIAPVIFTVLVIITSVLTWDSWYSVFIMSGLIVNTLSLSLSDPQKIRYCMFVKAPLCLIYNIIVLSVGGIFYECAVLVSSAIGIIKVLVSRNSN